MPHRISSGGSYRLDRQYPPPVGRLAIATGTTTRTAFRNVEACCDRLVERGRLDVLVALKARSITVAQLLDADRDDSLDDLLAKLNGEFGKTIMMVTHDPAAAERAGVLRKLDKGALK